ncbi:MAG: 23S rRNA (guanosine(2251)-2'-O)-methyltransferase RlmB [Acidimicrobiales bacterium]
MSPARGRPGGTGGGSGGGRGGTGRGAGGRSGPARATGGGRTAPAGRSAPAGRTAPTGRTAPGRTAPAGRTGPARRSAGAAPTGRSTGAGRSATTDDATLRRANPGRGVGGEQVEGRQAVRELLVAGRRRVRDVVMAAELDDAPILEDIRELCVARRVPLREVSRTKFDALTATQSAQGVFARAQELPEHNLDDLLRTRRGGRPPFLIALDGVTDPGNLGALLRSAEGSGVTGVIVPRHRAVHVTPAVTKAAAGAVEYVRIALVGGLPTALKQLNDAGVWTVGLDGAAETSLYSLPLSDQPVCLVFGAEGKGLSRLVRERCSQLAAIPLGGQLNSLNVAAATAVACFEIARQRAAALSEG